MCLFALQQEEKEAGFCIKLNGKRRWRRCPRLTANPKTQTVPLEAAGRILIETVCARFAMPPFPQSPFDGFAVNAGALPGTFPISVRRLVWQFPEKLCNFT